MKCHQHSSTDAIAICIHCGRAVCSACAALSDSGRQVCSAACAAATRREEAVLQSLLDKSLQSARATTCYYFLAGGLSAAGAVAAWFMLPAPFLIYFLAGTAVILLSVGFGHSRAARRHPLAVPAGEPPTVGKEPGL